MGVWSMNTYLMPYDFIHYLIITNNSGRNSPLPPHPPTPTPTPAWKSEKLMWKLSGGKHKRKDAFELSCKSLIISLSISILALHTPSVSFFLIYHILFLTSVQQVQYYETVCLASDWFDLWFAGNWRPLFYFCTHSEGTYLTLLPDSLEGCTRPDAVC